MTIGALPMACTEIGTEFNTATPFSLANTTLLALASLSTPYSVSSWVGKSSGFSVTAGYIDQGGGIEDYGFLTGSIGSVSPATWRGHTIQWMVRETNTGAFASVSFRLATAGLAQSYFTSLTINGTTYNSASASYFFNTTYTEWQWNTPDCGIVNPNTYPVTFT